MMRIEEIPSKQSFHINAPSATSVLLAGDFTQWQKKPMSMQKDKGGVWSAIVNLGPGKHKYRFIVDGEWRDDPECTSRVPNPFGGHDMVRDVSS
jgi:1,4-alpha-glucan branching enzyme